MDALEFVLKKIDPWLDKYISQGVSALSAEEALGVGVWLLEAEVNNGGFDQYYFNTGGVLAVRTVEFLEAIGACETASLLAAANADVPSLPLPLGREARNAVLDEVRESSRFSSLEAGFYPGAEDRISLLAAYLGYRENDA
jgi:hypothetical protein